MKAKHKYILTLFTLALFVISVFIVYFISTAVVTKAPQAEGGCPYKECSDDKDCEGIICNYMHGVCINNKCDWSQCGNTDQCTDNYCCESDIKNEPTKKQCFEKGIYTNDKYLCAPK